MSVDSRKTVLITGTNEGGIGNALAREFHAKGKTESKFLTQIYSNLADTVPGLRVFATARKTHDIEDLSLLGIETFSLEVHKPESILKLKNVISEMTGGALDILVNNAGRNYTIPALDLDLEEVQDLFDVNVFSVMRMCQAFAPLIIRAKGIIAQIGSLSGFMLVDPSLLCTISLLTISRPHIAAAYNASKAALHSYSNTLRVELEPFGASVIILYTGGVQSRIARQERSLPEDSLYLPANEGYLKRMTHTQQNAMPTDKYAKSVVSQLLVEKPKSWIWEGSYIWLMWTFWTFMPKHFLDNLFTGMFALNKLSRDEALAQLNRDQKYHD
ncbi:NAD(P)-binding protein [Aureobasidium subglaciale]|nr:NAD(P)-binding protein [Aureobasidium subglaciale]